MTAFGPLDEAQAIGDSEYGGGAGLVQLPPGGRELYGVEKLGVITRASKAVTRTPGALYKVTETVTPAGIVSTREINQEDPVDPVTGITVTEAQQDGPVVPK